LSYRVIGCAMEVHRTLGPGLLESAYQRCLAYEFDRQGITYQAEHPLPVSYKEIELDCGYRLDFLVDDSIILELKSVEKLLPIHEAQLMTQLSGFVEKRSALFFPIPKVLMVISMAT
jgi:GxxExxY protein